MIPAAVLLRSQCADRLFGVLLKYKVCSILNPGHIPWENHNWKSTCPAMFIATIFTIAIWMDKEIVVHLYNRLLLSHKKERIWVSCSEVDEPRACYTEWSKSGERQISYVKSYIWNLEKWWWTSLQGSNRDLTIENRLVDTVGEEKGGTNSKSSIETYRLPCKMDSHWEFSVWCRELSLVLCDSLEEWDKVVGKKEVQEGGTYVNP